jgi:predicted CoA-binding protein
MSTLPESVREFLAAPRIAVAGVSHDSRQPANAILRRLRETGHEVVPVNPGARELEGVPCYPDLASIPEPVQAVMVATHPDVSVDIARQCAEQGVERVWFHRSFGDGSVSPEAIRACEERGIHPVVGGCPLMFCGSVDVAHRCMRWWLQRRGRVPR